MALQYTPYDAAGSVTAGLNLGQLMNDQRYQNAVRGDQWSQMRTARQTAQNVGNIGLDTMQQLGAPSPAPAAGPDIPGIQAPAAASSTPEGQAPPAPSITPQAAPVATPNQPDVPVSSTAPTSSVKTGAAAPSGAAEGTSGLTKEQYQHAVDITAAHIMHADPHLSAAQASTLAQRAVNAQFQGMFGEHAGIIEHAGQALGNALDSVTGNMNSTDPHIRALNFARRAVRDVTASVNAPRKAALAQAPATSSSGPTVLAPPQNGSTQEGASQSVAQEAQASPELTALGSAIAALESGGRYNVRYAGIGRAPEEFDTSQPLTQENADYRDAGNGTRSSARGAFQFTEQTWRTFLEGNHLPATTPMTPDNQWRAFYWLARTRYASATGGDQNALDHALATGQWNTVARVLSNTWPSLDTVQNSQAKRTIFTNALTASLAGHGVAPTDQTETASATPATRSSSPLAQAAASTDASGASQPITYAWSQFTQNPAMASESMRRAEIITNYFQRVAEERFRAGNVDAGNQAMAQAFQGYAARDTARSFQALYALMGGNAGPANARIADAMGVSPGDVQIAPRSDSSIQFQMRGRDGQMHNTYTYTSQQFMQSFLEMVDNSYRQAMQAASADLQRARVEGEYGLAREGISQAHQDARAELQAQTTISQEQARTYQARIANSHIVSTPDGVYFYAPSDGTNPQIMTKIETQTVQGAPTGGMFGLFQNRPNVQQTVQRPVLGVS